MNTQIKKRLGVFVFLLLSVSLVVFVPRLVRPKPSRATDSDFYRPMISTEEILFVGQGDIVSDSIYENRDVARLNSTNAGTLFDLVKSRSPYITISLLEGAKGIFLIELSVADHGGFINLYGMAFNAVDKTILYETGNLLLDNTGGTIRQSQINSLEVCYYNQDQKSQICETNKIN